MRKARERVAEIRLNDRRERLARALRENLKRRKTRDRATTDLPRDVSAPDSLPSKELDAPDSLRPSPKFRS